MTKKLTDISYFFKKQGLYNHNRPKHPTRVPFNMKNILAYIKNIFHGQSENHGGLVSEEDIEKEIARLKKQYNI